MTSGALLMAYGTPARLDDLEAFYTHVRRGRAPSSEQLAELRSRYESIGGLSPLVARTEAQRAAIGKDLPPGWTTAVGMKHAAPFVEDAVADLAGAHHDRIVGVALAPHWSSSVAEYHERADEAARERGLTYDAVESWDALSPWVSFQAGVVRDALAVDDRAKVLFTAHSLPERVLEGGDPYPGRLESSARAIAGEVGVAGGRWQLAWQSAGRTPEPWRGPDIRDELHRLAGEDEEAVVVCPQGFASDNLELLYDLDVQARETADGLGLRFTRTATVNDDPGVMAALAERITTTGARG